MVQAAWGDLDLMKHLAPEILQQQNEDDERPKTFKEVQAEQLRTQDLHMVGDLINRVYCGEPVYDYSMERNADTIPGLIKMVKE